MSRISNSAKFDENGRLHVIDDNIPTDEEIKESLKDIPVEVQEKWKEEHDAIAKRIGILKSEE